MLKWINVKHCQTGKSNKYIHHFVKAVRHLLFEQIHVGESRIRKRYNFRRWLSCLFPATNSGWIRHKVLSITSGQSSVKTKLNLRIPVRTVTVARHERQGGKKIGEFEKRRSYFGSCLLSTRDNQREVSSRDAFTIVFRRCSHATSVHWANRVNAAQFTRACSLISTAAKVF